MAPVKSRAVASAKAKNKRKGFRGVQKQFVNSRNGGNQTATTTRSADSDHVASSGQYDDSSSVGITATQKKLLNSSFTLEEQDDIPFTRARTADLGLNTSSSTVCANKGYALIDLDLLASFIKNNLTCKRCLSRKPSLLLLSNEKKRYGLAINFDVECSNCSNKIQFESSKKLAGRSFDVNRRSVLAINSLKGGRQTLAKFCGTMNLPPPVSSNAFNDHLNKCSKAACTAAEKIMIDASNRLKAVMKSKNPVLGFDDVDGAIPVSVSVDGTWQKRGYSSKLGVVFVIGVETGEILDYEVLSLFCQECNVHERKNEKTRQSIDWKENHRENCSINYSGSSGGMESEGAVRIFERSIARRGLKYTTFVGDGDSSTFQAVSQRMKDKYGSRYDVKKEECLGHIQKRMGNALRNLTRDMKGKKLDDGKTVGGAGRLTKNKIDALQRYYGKAIRENADTSVAVMRDAIWAIFFHSIKNDQLSSDEQHKFCPQGENSWCKYVKDKLLGTKRYDDSKRLPSVFSECLRPIFEKLTAEDLLSRCQMGLTQNSNESAHAVLWGKCSKTSFCGKTRLLLAVGETVCVFNTGAGAQLDIMEAAGIKTSGANTTKMLRREDFLRKKSTSQKVSKKYKMYRINKKKDKIVAAKETKKSYKAGAFGINTESESNQKKKKTSTAAKKSSKGRNKRKRKFASEESDRSDKSENDLPQIVMPIPVEIIRNTTRPFQLLP